MPAHRGLLGKVYDEDVGLPKAVDYRQNLGREI